MPSAGTRQRETQSQNKTSVETQPLKTQTYWYDTEVTCYFAFEGRSVLQFIHATLPTTVERMLFGQL